jgi:hypothetical protein
MKESDDPHPLADRIATSIKDRIEGDGSSRRRFLNRSVVAGGALLALGGGTGFAVAQESDDSMTEEMTATFDDVRGTDIDVLNYALSLEHLENAFYREGLETFNESDFVVADSLQSFDEETRLAVYGYVQTVGNHEATHVDVLTQAVELLGGDPAQEATYDFGIETVGDFLALGQVLENTGVAAYAGAAPYVESPDLLGAALSIHSVEARHAAILNWVNGESPFPNAFDPASSQGDVLEAVSQFIDSGDPGNGTETPDGNETTTPPSETPGNETTTPGTPSNETTTAPTSPPENEST